MPRSGAKTVFLRNQKNGEDEWEELHVSIGSWVTMMPKTSGYHGVSKHKINDSSNHWKGRVKEFIFGPGCKTVIEILVEHAYDSHAMAKEDIAKKCSFPSLACNCLCSSDFTDLVSAKSITSVLEVYNFRIGQLLFGDSSKRSLRDRGIWFHTFHYSLSLKGVGKLTEIDLADLATLGAEFSDQKLLTAYQQQLGCEVYRNLRERGGVRCAFKLFLPLTVFSCLFQFEESIKLAPQTYTVRDVSNARLEQIFSGNWKRREHETGEQLTECVPSTNTFVFRYRLPKQHLYCNFFIERRKLVKEKGHWKWRAIEDHGNSSPLMELTIGCGNAPNRVLNVEEDWSLHECREYLNTFKMYGDFQYFLDDRKVGYRRECSVLCKECKPPRKLSIRMVEV